MNKEHMYVAMFIRMTICNQFLKYHVACFIVRPLF